MFLKNNKMFEMFSCNRQQIKDDCYVKNCGNNPFMNNRSCVMPGGAGGDCSKDDYLDKLCPDSVSSESSQEDEEDDEEEEDSKNVKKNKRRSKSRSRNKKGSRKRRNRKGSRKRRKRKRRFTTTSS